MIYDYTPTRERAGPEAFLKDFRGHLQADAYVVYDSFFADPARGLVEVGCWAHARRHFHNALENDKARMGGVLAMIAHLYQVEKASRRRGLRGDALRMAREQDARPMLDRLHEYLLTIREQVLPKSDAGQATAYALKNWTALTRYCADGDLSLGSRVRLIDPASISISRRVLLSARGVHRVLTLDCRIFRQRRIELHGVKYTFRMQHEQTFSSYWFESQVPVGCHRLLC